MPCLKLIQQKGLFVQITECLLRFDYTNQYWKYLACIMQHITTFSRCSSFSGNCVNKGARMHEIFISYANATPCHPLTTNTIMGKSYCQRKKCTKRNLSFPFSLNAWAAATSARNKMQGRLPPYFL